MRINNRKTSKYNNQQWWQWNDSIVLRDQKWWFIAIIWSLGNILLMFAAIPNSGCTRPWWGVTDFFEIKQSTMVTVKWCHCDQRKIMMIYRKNMITWQHTSNVSSDTNNAVSCGRSRLLVLTARRRCIIEPVQFIMSGLQAARRGGRGAVMLQWWSP